jgi:dihydrofolate reductase
MIVAVARDNVIGCKGRLPWRIPEDLRYFKDVTMNHTVIMGRKTFDSIGSPLPGRRNLVLSRKANLSIENCIVLNDLQSALKAATQEDPLPFVIGGASLYEQSLPFCRRIYLTQIDRCVEGETRFPAINDKEFHLVQKKEAKTKDVTFVVLDRIG